MSAISRVSAGPMPKISAVKPAGKLAVDITWSEGPRAPRTERVDLAPLVNSMKLYKPLRGNVELFSTVHVNEDGEALAWGVNNAIDMAATTVERLAEDMMSASDLRDWIGRLRYTHNTAAAQLGYSRRQLENFLSGKTEIPRVCVLACMALEQRHLVRHANESPAVERAEATAAPT